MTHIPLVDHDLPWFMCFGDSNTTITMSFVTTIYISCHNIGTYKTCNRSDQQNLDQIGSIKLGSNLII